MGLGDVPSSQGDVPVVTAVASYGFFTVVDSGASNSPCQGFRGLITLYFGSNATIQWSSTEWTANHYSPSAMWLVLMNNADSTNYSIASDVPISTDTTSFTFEIPLTAPLSNSSTYSIEGHFFDSDSNSNISFPTNTSDVMVFWPGQSCDRQNGSVSVNVPLAAGLSSTVAVLLITFSVFVVLRARLLQKREDKGKFWMDGPHRKDAVKPNYFDAILTKLRPRKRSKKGKNGNKSGDNESENSGSTDDGGSTTGGAADDEFVLGSNDSKNPFLLQGETLEMHQIPLKDESSDSSGTNTKAKAPPARRTSFTVPFFSKTQSTDKPEKDDGASRDGTVTGVTNQFRTMVDPMTGQLKAYVVVDSRGPPTRNIGGSSRWSPPLYVLGQKHRVLTAFDAVEPDELTILRNENVVVETVFEDGWAIVHKLVDKAKPVATNTVKQRNVMKMVSSPGISANEHTPRTSWGSKMLRLLKEEDVDDQLGDAATGGKRGLVPYNCLFMLADLFAHPAVVQPRHEFNTSV
ncbi:hypothetical protein HDU84_001896 [Entophlyctis sp. JEL0112]|nr:hypothetical protein HDU84_001896 [Entophlyctis sp. JEL0112]